MFNEVLTLLVALVGFVGAGAAVRGSLLRANAQAWREQAEQRAFELSALRTEMAEVRGQLADTAQQLRDTREELARLKDKYLEMLELLIHQRRGGRRAC